MNSTIIIIVALAGGFVGGVLFGRRNTSKVEASVAVVEAKLAALEAKVGIKP